MDPISDVLFTFFQRYPKIVPFIIKLFNISIQYIQALASGIPMLEYETPEEEICRKVLSKLGYKRKDLENAEKRKLIINKLDQFIS